MDDNDDDDHDNDDGDDDDDNDLRTRSMFYEAVRRSSPRATIGNTCLFLSSVVLEQIYQLALQY